MLAYQVELLKAKEKDNILPTREDTRKEGEERHSILKRGIIIEINTDLSEIMEARRQ